MFNKEDFKNGMIVQFDNDKLAIYLYGTFITCNNGGYPLDVFNNNLICTDCRNNDKIMKIILPKFNKRYEAGINFWLSKEFLNHPHEVLWKRDKEYIEMTLEEVCSELGREIKIIKG